MQSLLSLPTEVLDAIFTSLYEPSDLLSLALASRTLVELIVPDHLHWRSVRLSYYDGPSLRSLVDNSGRVLGLVQRIRLEDNHGLGADVSGYKRISEAQDAPVYTDAEKDTWCRTFLNISGSLRRLVTVEVRIAELADFLRFVPFVVSLLGACPSFTRLTIYGDGMVNGDLYGLKDCLVSLFKLGAGMRTLTHFSWTSDDYFSSPIFHTLSKGLSCCPELEYLDLSMEYDPRILSDFPPPAKSQDLWTARWPHLRTLELDRIRLDECTGIFFREHRLLEKLTLNRVSYAWEPVDFVMPPDALPNLRELWWPIQQYTEALLTLVRPLPDGRRRPLESLSMVTLTTFENYDPTAGDNHTEDGYFSPQVFTEFCAQVAETSTLVQLGLENQRASGIDKIVQLSSMAGSVRGLLLRLRSWPSSTTMSAIAKALGGFSFLTQLHFLDSSPDNYENWQGTLSELARYSTGLKHVNGWDKGSDGWIPSAAYKACRQCTLLETYIDPMLL